MATVSQIAAPQGRRGLIQVPVGRHCAGPPRSSESGDSFADRSPQGRHGLIQIPAGRHCAGLAKSSERGNSFADHSSQGHRGLIQIPVGRHCAGLANSSGRYDGFAVRSTSGTARPHPNPRRTSLRWPSQELRKLRQFRRSQPRRDGEASSRSLQDVTALALPGAQKFAWRSERGDSFAERSPQGRRGLIQVAVGRHCAAPIPGGAQKVATVSRNAAAQRRRGLIQIPVGRHCAGPAKSSERGDSFADRSPPPRDGEASSRSP